MSDLNRLIEIFRIGISLFLNGQRTKSIRFFTQVIEESPNVPTYRMVSACLLAETYRGLGDFVLAEEYYELSVKEAGLVPKSARRGNEWYEHYRPRASFGLITILRRTLSTEHDQIKSLLKDTRDQYESFPNDDLFAQLHVAEGVYFRQLGDIEGSISNISNGIKNTFHVAPPYLFWHPEHFEALLLASYLSSPGFALQASKQARKILRSESESWSSAFALIGLIHLFFVRVLSKNPKEGQTIINKQKEEVNKWFEKLNKSSEFEKDPLLTTETILLELIWNKLLEKDDRVNDEFIQLDNFLNQSGTDMIWLLRAAELASIKGILSKNERIDHEQLSSIWNKGAALLDKYKKPLQSYGLSITIHNQLSEIFLQHSPKQSELSNWNSTPIRSLRIRLWP